MAAFCVFALKFWVSICGVIPGGAGRTGKGGFAAWSTSLQDVGYPIIFVPYFQDINLVRNYRHTCWGRIDCLTLPLQNVSHSELL